MAITLFHFTFLPEYSRFDVTVADILILTASNPQYSFLGMYLVPISCIGMLVFCKGDYSVNRVIRYGSYKRIWYDRVIKTVFVSLIISVMILLSTAAVALVYANDFVAFDDPRGIFAYANNGETTENPSPVLIVTMFWFCCFLLVLFANMLWSLLDTLFYKKWIPFMLVLLISMMDAIPAGIRTIYLWVSIGYGSWLPNGRTNFWLAAMLVAIFAAIGIIQANRKETLNAG